VDRTIGVIAVRIRTEPTPAAESPAPLTGRRPDQLATFAPLVTAIRWGTVAIGLALASLGTAGLRQLAFGIPLVAYAAMRTFRPLHYLEDRISSLVMVLLEVGICLAVVVGTGYWDSPYVFCLTTAIVAAGFARGFGFAIRTALTASAAVALPLHLENDAAPFLTTFNWTGELLLIALVAGYARRLFGQVEERSWLARQANDLLVQLHEVAQTLPASLDLGETVDSTVDRLREMVAADAAVVLLRDDAAGGTEQWHVVAARGTRLPRTLPVDYLPGPVRRVLASKTPELVTGEPGLSQLTRSGIYAPLHARGTVIGVLVAEGIDESALGEHDLRVVTGLADQAALAIDNARRFGRLRTVGADEERTRIARDLHDRVGQSLAYLAFELDRITRRARGSGVEEDLARLREDVRKVVTEVRDTLYDLRTEVTEEQGLVPTLRELLERVRQRTGVTVGLEAAETVRLPLRQEREMWRVAQEAITNAARHAEASRIDVRWRCDEHGAVLEVEDDGRGLAPDAATGMGSYGMLGMRERAGSIGAVMEIESSPGKGTIVRCRLGAPGR
jgi:signal transduction histidine kinase